MLTTELLILPVLLAHKIGSRKKTTDMNKRSKQSDHLKSHLELYWNVLQNPFSFWIPQSPLKVVGVIWRAGAWHEVPPAPQCGAPGNLCRSMPISVTWREACYSRETSP